MNKYRHQAYMHEISGIARLSTEGARYEEDCQNMLEAGVLWLQEHPGVKLELVEFDGVVGYCRENNDDTIELGKVIIGAVLGRATEIMYHEVMRRLVIISGVGWEAYCIACTRITPN